MDVKLSIIVPTLKGEVPRSLESAAEREGVEIVVVKGVSPVGKARNEGLRRARGEWIAWVDSDDEVTDDWLVEILSKIENDSTVHLQPSSSPITPDIISFNVRQEWHDGSGRESSFLDGRKCGQLWSKVFRRSLFDGLEFEGAVHEDYQIQCQMPREAKRVHLDKVLYVYKRRAEGLSQHRDAKATVRALWGLIKICNSWEMAKGIWERIWDFAKTPIRRLIGR